MNEEQTRINDEDHDVFEGLGVRVKLKDSNDFLKVKETLTRMGIDCSKNGENIIVQSCHILHKRGEYAILHFKELFILDGKTANIDDEDLTRRDVIANLLSEWGLVELRDTLEEVKSLHSHRYVKIIPFKEKAKWTLKSKYTIGGKQQQKRTTQ